MAAGGSGGGGGPFIGYYETFGVKGEPALPPAEEGPWVFVRSVIQKDGHRVAHHWRKVPNGTKDRPSPVSFLAVRPTHRSAIGFSTDYASKAHGLIEVGTTVEVEKQVRERFRPLDLEVHVQSAEAFELCFLDVTRKHAREAKRYLGVSGPIDLGTYALRINAGVSSCCTVPLEGVATFEVGDVVTLSVRNTSKEPARFRANLVGFAER
jgi:hypothetical protein